MRRYSLRGIVLGYLLIILAGPLLMMLWRTAQDLGGAWAAISAHDTLRAFELTLIVTAIAVPLNTAFGVACALVVVRSNIRGKGLINAFVDLPLALSPVVVGLSLVLLYGAGGWLGFLGDHGVQVLFAWPAIILATVFVSLPFVAREVVPTLREVGDEQEQAARTLGASGWQTFWRVTLPTIRWAVIYGVILTTARCFGEFGAVAIVSGNIEGKTQTATLRVDDAYQFAYGHYAGAYGISLVLAVMSIVVLFTMMLARPKEGTL
ncbi:MAG TPA: sulfate ABC transporter permease subunit [Gaiellaceae bacterium]|jgi:sulfate transport system permease protein|nr:sulfate ABC transporter permease subunit [Gaiellaceae bacterium]